MYSNNNTMIALSQSSMVSSYLLLIFSNIKENTNCMASSVWFWFNLLIISEMWGILALILLTWTEGCMLLDADEIVLLISQNAQDLRQTRLWSYSWGLSAAVYNSTCIPALDQSLCREVQHEMERLYMLILFYRNLFSNQIQRTLLRNSLINTMSISKIAKIADQDMCRFWKLEIPLHCKLEEVGKYDLMGGIHLS